MTGVSDVNVTWLEALPRSITVGTEGRSASRLGAAGVYTVLRRSAIQPCLNWSF